MQTTLDGFVAGPNGEMDWLVWDWDEKLKEYVGALNDPVDLILLGRNLAEGFIPTWKTRSEDDPSDEFARKMTDGEKIVFSKTPGNPDWKNTRTVETDSSEEIRRLKASDTGGDMIVYGGAQFVSSLVRDNLIDEYNLFVNPVILGDGMPIFASVAEKLDLKLVESHSYECGIVAMRYEPKK